MMKIHTQHHSGLLAGRLTCENCSASRLKMYKCYYTKYQFIFTHWLYALHDMSVLAIRRTMQINSRPMEIIIYFLKQSGDLIFVWMMSLISTDQSMYESNG